MKAEVAIILFCLLVALIVYAAVRLTRWVVRRHRLSTAKWEIMEHSGALGYTLFLEKEGEEREHFETISKNIPAYEYEEHLSTARIDAQEICDARNRRLNAG